MTRVLLAGMIALALVAVFNKGQVRGVGTPHGLFPGVVSVEDRQPDARQSDNVQDQLTQGEVGGVFVGVRRPDRGSVIWDAAWIAAGAIAAGYLLYRFTAGMESSEPNQAAKRADLQHRHRDKDRD